MPSDSAAQDMFGSDSEEEEVVTSPPVEASALCEVRHLTGVGGNRGVFATKDIPAGSLVVLEWPVLSWTDLNLSAPEDMAELVLRITQDPIAWKVSKTLHPVKLDDVDAQDLQDAQDTMEEAQLSHILAQAQQSVDQQEVVRIYLTLKHNGFGSGLYHDLCMINHSCDANSMKFEPRAGSRGASEVWTVRPVRAGEEITISYFSPLETISSNVRTYLSSQHKFECTCTRCQAYLKWEDDVKVTEEKQCGDDHDHDCHESQLVEMLREQEDQLEDWEFQLTNLQYERKDVEILERMMGDVESEVMQKVEDVQDVLNAPDWLRVMARAKLLVTSICMKAVALLENNKSKLLSHIAHKLVATNLSLYSLQRQYLGADHPDLATTLFDVINGIELAQQTESKADFDSFFDSIAWDEWFTSSLGLPKVVLTASNVVKTLKKEGGRLKDLYMLVKRCPSAAYCQKAPGQSFWGK